MLFIFNRDVSEDTTEFCAESYRKHAWIRCDLYHESGNSLKYECFKLLHIGIERCERERERERENKRE
jgi:hypothetical protein